MNLKEAYSILELPQPSTPEEAKKRYREFTKKYHPDINKENGAEDRFKKINEAYQIVSTGKSTDREEMHRQPRYSTSNPFGRQVEYQVENINLHTTISFKESVLGCKKDIKYQRKVKCKECQGQGETVINNGCEKCHGRGQVIINKNNMIFVSTCDKCGGKTKTTPCTNCNQLGVLNAETVINVSIVGGIQNESILRINGMGNFIGSFGPLEQYTDAHMRVSVIPEDGLSIDGFNVISTISISLLEALVGCQKTVKTISGDKYIDIKPLSRNKEEITLPNLGVSGTGFHRVILDIKYPDDTKSLINVLSEKGN